jgi:hypothetical protein
VPVPTFCAGFLQLGALGGEADFGEAQEDQAEDGRGVFLGLEAGVGPKLVSGVPEAFFQRGVIVVFFRWSDPVHDCRAQRISNCFKLKVKTRKQIMQ